MGVLHRWEDSDDDGHPEPAVWRYDESSSEDHGPPASSSSTPLSKLGPQKTPPPHNYLVWVGESYFIFVSASPPRTDDESEHGPEDALVDEPIKVSLTLSMLESHHGAATCGDEQDSNFSVFAKNGMNERRIRKAVRNPCCSCQCSMPCQLLLRVCQAFWCLAKSTQDSILWSLQTSGDPRHKRYYQIEGWVCCWPTSCCFQNSHV